MEGGLGCRNGTENGDHYRVLSCEYVLGPFRGTKGKTDELVEGDLSIYPSWAISSVPGAMLLQVDSS